VFGIRRDAMAGPADYEADKLWIRREIWRAHAQWETAKKQFDWALGDDEVEYSIFALAAAENRFDMLLRQAKRLTWGNRPFTVKGVE
jgi:hypothetical protein